MAHGESRLIIAIWISSDLIFFIIHETFHYQTVAPGHVHWCVLVGIKACCKHETNSVINLERWILLSVSYTMILYLFLVREHNYIHAQWNSNWLLIYLSFLLTWFSISVISSVVTLVFNFLHLRFISVYCSTYCFPVKLEMGDTMQTIYASLSDLMLETKYLAFFS